MKKYNITESIIMEDYNKLKNKALESFRRNNLELACDCISMAANFMYQCNIIYADDDLEKLLHEIGSNLSHSLLSQKDFLDTEICTCQCCNMSRIVFYDYFTLDNRGLTEQYMDTLIDFNGQILFVNCQKNKEKSTHIIKKLETANNVHIYNVESISYLEIVKELWKVIYDFRPNIFIEHTHPSDISGILLANLFEGKCKRYLINLTDHAFWLGKTSFDFYFEFRNYGYNISREFRKIPVNKLLNLPYYPIINEDIPFRGFDFETAGKRIIFSGGSVYKIQGSSLFLDLVSWILDNYPDTIFLYLGNGNKSILKDFVTSRHYENRFYYEDERDDIYEVFKHCDIFLNTYPISGALMVQYAIVCGKIPISFAKNYVHTDSDVNELLFDVLPIRIQFDDIEELKQAFDKYLNHDKKNLFEDEKKVKSAIISKDKFKEMLYSYLENPINQKSFTNYNVDIKGFYKSYIDRWNENTLSYYRFFINKYHLSINLAFIKYFILYSKAKFAKIILHNFKHYE